MLGWRLTLFSLIVWGVTFASTRALLLDFSPLEIQAIRFSLVLMLPLVAWGLTDSGFYALDGSFSVDIDPAENAARFSRTLNLVNLAFLGVLASALTFIAWSAACARLGGVLLMPIADKPRLEDVFAQCDALSDGEKDFLDDRPCNEPAQERRLFS